MKGELAMLTRDIVKDMTEEEILQSLLKKYEEASAGTRTQRDSEDIRLLREGLEGYGKRLERIQG